VSGDHLGGNWLAATLCLCFSALYAGMAGLCDTDADMSLYLVYCHDIPVASPQLASSPWMRSAHVLSWMHARS
jgi:hypothetical protein